MDIGTRLIKAVEVSLEENATRLTKFHFAEIDFPLGREKTGEALKTLLEKFRPGTKSVNISLSAPSAIVRFISMPEMKEDDLKNSLRFEAEKYIPFNISEVFIDAVIIPGKAGETKQMRVLLAAAKKEAVYACLAMLKEAGLSASLADIDSFACFNAFCNSFRKLDESKSTALLNIGYTHTNVLVLRGDQPFFTRDIQTGSKDIAKAVSAEFQVGEKEADKLIFNPGENALRVFEVAKGVLNDFVEELRLSFGYYENQYGSTINEIYLSGGAAHLGGISGHLEENFGVKPVLWDPFAGFERSPDIDKKLLEPARPHFAVAAGLAMRR